MSAAQAFLVLDQQDGAVAGEIGGGACGILGRRDRAGERRRGGLGQLRRLHVVGGRDVARQEDAEGRALAELGIHDR